LDSNDRRFMERALALAEGGRGWVEPNPMVGAVVVRDGVVVGEGRHESFGAPHAERNALRQAGDRARGATMYVTLEPCTHEGKTPPCAPAVLAAGVSRVVVAVADPTAKTRGRGLAYLREHGVCTELGLCRREAVVQNAAFFKACATGRPLVTAKWAMSADGKMAHGSGAARWISGEASREEVHRVRGLMDAVIVGARTAALDDPLLTCRHDDRRRIAARVVVCGRSVPPPDCRLVRTVGESPVLLAYPEGRPPGGTARLRALGCEPVPCPAGPGGPARADVRFLLERLAERGAVNVLVEGGGHLLGSFFDAGQIDRAMVFVAPVLIGGREAVVPVLGAGVESMEHACRLVDATVRTVGEDVLLEGWALPPDKWVPEDEVTLA
jgi:diaminohydroxyphosphoribosylaminopyrimidine deaminase/5-amino-6-(5-phosphoribosylamino)uracil reductase